MFPIDLPPPTRYDWYFAIGRIPVRVHPWFWLMTILLGASLRDPVYILIWVIVVFVSILVHELGHALVMQWYGRPASIVLHLLGGTTVAEPGLVSLGRTLTPPRPIQEILIPFAGPLAGFLLAGLVLLGARLAGGQIRFLPAFAGIPWPYVILPAHSPLPATTIDMVLWVNLFWGLINLMPVYPLDGGVIAHHILLQRDPQQGMRRFLGLSFVTAVVVALAGLLLLHSTYLCVFFGLLAFQSYRLWSTSW